MTSLKRIQQEIKDLKNTTIPLVSAGPITNNNLYHWEGTIIGPDDTPYEDGIFLLDIYFPKEYPFKAPKIEFKTKIYHPNINSQGQICLDILKNEWSPALTIVKVLLSIISLLTDPNPNDPLEPNIAQIYLKNRDLYNKQAKLWTYKYAE